MKEQSEDLFLLSLAARITAEKAKELYANDVLSPEQYIKLCEYMKLDEVDIKDKIKELAESIKSYEEAEERKAEERAARASENVEKRKQKLIEQKENLGTAATMTPEKKAKFKKFGILGTVILFILVISGFGLNYLFTNVIGFTDVDLADYAIVYYDTSSDHATPSLDGNWNYYSEGGYYTDGINQLVESGIYNEDEATNLMPDEISTKVANIVYDYELSTSNELVNGDQFEATIMYDQDLAKENKLNVTNNKFNFTIKGLREPVEVTDITEEMLSQIEFTEEDAIEDVKDDQWRPEDYKYEVESTHYFLITEESYYDDMDDTYIEKVIIVKKTDVEDSEDVTFVAKGLDKYVYKTDTEVTMGDYVYDIDSINTYNGELEDVLDDYENYGYEAVEIGGDL